MKKHPGLILLNKKCRKWSHATYLGSAKRQIIYESAYEKRATYYRLVCEYKGIRKVFVGLLSKVNTWKKAHSWNGRSICGNCKEFHDWAKRVYNDRMAREVWSSVIIIQLFKGDLDSDKELWKEFQDSMEVIAEENASKYPVIKAEVKQKKNKSRVCDEIACDISEPEIEDDDEDDDEDEDDSSYEYDFSEDEHDVLVKMIKAQLNAMQVMKTEFDQRFIKTAKKIYNRVK